MKGLFKNNLFVVYPNAKVFAIVMLFFGVFTAVVISPSLLIGYVLLGMTGVSAHERSTAHFVRNLHPGLRAAFVPFFLPAGCGGF